MNQTEINSIKKHHTPSIEGLVSIIKTRKPFSKMPFILSATLSFFFLIVFICNPNKSFFAVEKIVEIVTICFPGLLGFSLAGYTMVVGLPNAELIEHDSEINDYTLYQVLSSFFALSIILQIIATAMGFCMWWVIKIDMPTLLHYNNEFVFNIINISSMFILFFISLYSICLTPYVAINLFSLSQVNSAFFTIRKLQKEKQRKS